MSVSRRRFLELGTLAVAATVVPSEVKGAAQGSNARSQRVLTETPIRPPLEPPIRTQSEVVSLHYMTKQTFAGLVNSTFTARDADGKPVNLTLVSVEEITPAKNTTGVVLRVPNPAKEMKHTSSFVLRFRSKSGKPLMQGTYSFNHVSLGNFSLFVVPAGGAQPYCSAVFSRI